MKINYKQIIGSSLLGLGIVAITGYFSNPNPVSAAVLTKTYNFGNILGGDTVGDAYNSYFQMDVTNDANDDNTDDGFVTFFIINNANITGSLAPNAAIKKVNFDFNPDSSVDFSAPIDPTKFRLKELNHLNIGTVDFKTSSGNLPQGNNLNPKFDTDYGSVKNGGNNNSIQGGERLGIAFDYATTGDNFTNIQGIIAALDAAILNPSANPGLRVGLHVGSLPNGKSDTYINISGPTPPDNNAEIPEPSATVGLGIFALGGLRLLRRRN